MIRVGDMEGEDEAEAPKITKITKDYLKFLNLFEKNH
jgi:hypothetical protein